MISRIILALAIVLGVTATSQQVAQAHVLFVDRNTNIAAVFHSNPDDDPVAGEVSQLYLDIQDKNSDVRIPYDGYDLVITDDQGKETKLPVHASGTTIIANYTFPSQGLYKITLSSQPKYDAFQKVVISGSQRVERGVGSTPAKPSVIATIGMIGSLTVVFLLGVIYINNREQIIKKSVF